MASGTLVYVAIVEGLYCLYDLKLQSSRGKCGTEELLLLFPTSQLPFAKASYVFQKAQWGSTAARSTSVPPAAPEEASWSSAIIISPERIEATGQSEPLRCFYLSLC